MMYDINFSAEFGCGKTRFNEIFLINHFYEKSYLLNIAPHTEVGGAKLTKIELLATPHDHQSCAQ